MTYGDRWWCWDGAMYQGLPQRDLREDGPEWYRDGSGQWVRRTMWTVGNYETLRDWATYCRYLRETTPAEREQLKAK